MPPCLKVLYIEDDIANLKVVENLLKKYPHFELLSATNGRLGCEIAKRNLPDIILLDIHLPDMNGYQVFKTILSNKEMQNIPVIALSADAMPCDIERGLAAGFKKYLTKPVNLHELVETLDEYMVDSNEQENQRV